MASIKISSVNCQGLGKFEKRRDVFQHLRQKHHSIYLLQDTHFTCKLERQIRSEWGFECLFSSNNSRSRGVAILFNNNFEFEIVDTIKDTQGNYIITVLKVFNKYITLVNLYGPNKDHPDFFHTIQKKVENIWPTNIVIMGGDWNLVLDPSVDYHNYKHNNNINSQETVIDMLTKMELVDIWRELNPEILRYTWRRPTPFQQARLDFFLVSDNIITNIKSADILYSYRSDHSLVTVEVAFKEEEKYRSFWKFNSSLLKDKEYVKIINDTIEYVTEQYAVPVYAKDSLKTIPTDQIQFTISDQLFLDTLFMEIRSKTITYSIRKKQTERQEEKKLEKEIHLLEINGPLFQNDMILLQNKKEQLFEFRKSKMEGILLRSKVKWAAQGEKINKYFCSLEKRHFVSKQMLKIVTKDGRTLVETGEMIDEAKKFYQDLYEERETLDIDINNYVNMPRLDMHESDLLEGQITREEASEVLSKMQNDKSPGTDGMTVNFLKFFWGQLSNFVVRSINEGFVKGEMSITQKEGIIISLPKGDKPREYLKNWRPITLLNVTYKIASATIANRIKTVLPKLISEDQTGFMAGRYIGENIRMLYDLINYLEHNKLPGLLVSVDFEKAFDSVDWKYMHNVLRAFGFGEDICKWISTLYCNIKSYVVLNGRVSQSFNVKRGCRQGDPISPYLFLLCAEILGCKVRSDEEIKGIEITDTEFKISQFADDTSFTLNGEKTSYEKLFETLEHFRCISGLKLNYEKTANVWLGAKKNSNERYLSHKEMKWNPYRYKILGIWFTNELKKLTEINTQDKYAEVKRLFKIWSKRLCTPLGRIAILKSLILSKLVYLWILLPNPPDKDLKEIQKLCFEFVWDKKPDKIKRKFSVQNIENGGIGIPNIYAFVQSLKLSWIRRLLSKPSKWQILLQTQCPEVKNLNKYGSKKFLKCNCNQFWKDVFVAYDNFNKNIDIQDESEVLSEPIFYNDKFKISNTAFCFKGWTDKNIFHVKDIVNEQGVFLTYDEFTEHWQLKTNYLHYHGCCRVIREFMNNRNIQLTNSYANTESKAVQTITSVNKGSTLYYNILLEKNIIYEIKPFIKWENKIAIYTDWFKVLKKIIDIKEIKFQWFQLRICHQLLVTNSLLKKMGVVECDNCNFCKKEKDSIHHYLWSCDIVQIFWRNLEKKLKEACEHCIYVNFNIELILFGTDEKNVTDEICDLIILFAKFYIYRCRINKVTPNLATFMIDLKHKYIIEKYAYSLQMRYDTFVKKWGKYLPLINHE